MCLTTNTPEILVAQEDITVYKYLFTTRVKYRQTGIMRLFRKWKTVQEIRTHNRQYAYKVGEIQPLVEIVPIEWAGNWEVKQGYHSDVTFNKFQSNAEFKIPKGTKYIKGWYNDEKNRENYVSETIVFVKML